MPKDSALAEFINEVNRPDTEINLARAVLVMGRFEYPDLDVRMYEAQLNMLAHQVNGVSISAHELSLFLFDSLGYRGNDANYFDPRNSFLNDVLDRRLGIPITLSVLFIEIARRVGIEVYGVGLPGHFIVSVRGESQQVDGAVYLDPYHGGQQLTIADCKNRIHELTNGSIAFDPAFLEPVSSRYILNRILNNLKNIYTNTKDYLRARHVVERLLVLNPDNPLEIRNLGLLSGAIGESRRAVELLETYLQRLPDAPDAKNIREYVAALARNISRWN